MKLDGQGGSKRSWGRGNMINIYCMIFFPIPSRHQWQAASQLKVGTCVHYTFLTFGVLSGFNLGKVLNTSMSSYVQRSWRVWKTLLPWSQPAPLVLTTTLLLFHRDPWAHRVGWEEDISLETELSKVSHSLHSARLQGSVNTHLLQEDTSLMMVARNSGLSPSLVWPVGVTDFFF